MNSCLNSSLGKSSLIRARATFSLILDPFKVDTNSFISIDVFEIAKTNEELDIESDLEI